MCGITGFVDFTSDTNPLIIRKMTDEIKYRGPDSSGKYIDDQNNLSLGVRRLSIIDLITGDQPISNEDGTVTVVYNGEIYNYQELKKQLEKDKHKFKTNSDTEVLVHLYEKYGERMPQYLNGMFSFAIWDKKNQKLFLARDRAGIKPLYYLRLDKKLIFGSELKTILKFLKLTKQNKPEINLESLSLYCYLGYLPGEFSMFEGIKKLLPGYSISFSKSGFILKKFFKIKLDDNNKFDNNHDEEIVLEELIENSVRLQLRADVAVGVLLSGGIDSSLISYYISKIKKLKSFSIGFEDKDYDESRYAIYVAKKLNTEHYKEVFKSKDVIETFKEIAVKLDEPLADASLLPTYKVCKLAKKFVKVVLSGDGGDELFGGYPNYQGHILAEYFRFIPQSILDRTIPIINILPNLYRWKSYDKSEVYKNFISGYKKEVVERELYWLKVFFLGKNLVYKKPDLCFINDLLPNMNQVDSVRKAQIVDFYTSLPEKYFVKSDRASMYNSLEIRVPYLDNEIVDYVFSNKRNYVNLFKTKILLRNLANKYFPDISARPKKGFGIPLTKWLREDKKVMNFAYYSLQNKKINQFIERRNIENIWQDHQKSKANNGGLIWMLIILSGWLDNWY